MRNILITGGSRGIGRACVELFTSLGDRVFFTCKSNLNAAQELSERTGAIFCYTCDIQDLKKKIDSQGGLDVLINNAGIAEQKMFQDITDEDWDNMFNTNVRDMFRITRLFYEDFINKKSGKIVNVSSMWGVSGASCEVHYSASKAAVIGFTKALAKEAGPSGINVNCIAPGVIDTDMNSHLSAEDIAELSEFTPLGRIGTPQEAARVIEFLCSEKASFITGQTIICDGGFL